MGRFRSTEVLSLGKRWRTLGAFLTGLVILVTLAAPAPAKIIERERYEGTFTDSHDDCGFPVHVEGSFSGLFLLREANRHLAGAFLFVDNFSWEEVHTGNGRSITLRGHGVVNEHGAVEFDGSIFEFHTIVAGQPLAIYDANGKLVLRDRGVIRITYLFDTLGDDEPGGNFVELLNVEFGGPHPGEFLEDPEYCALFE
jgi:hypothetical protein